MSAETKPNKQLVIHTDPGCDDAVAVFSAISAASGRFTEVSSIATYGNRSTRQTARNLLTVGSIVDQLRQSDASFPTLRFAFGAKMASDKKVAFSENADFIQGKDGMEGLHRRPTHQLEASGVIYDRLGVEPQTVTDILSLGAPTELAQMMVRPDLEGKIERVTVMGGTIFEEGNYSMHAEWNLANDPSALETTLRICDEREIPFTLVPLDLTQKPELHLTSDRFAWLERELKSRGSPSMADTIKTLVGPDSTYYNFFTSATKTTGNRNPPYNRVGFDGSVVHDLTAQIVQTDPENFEIYPMQVMVGDKGQIGTARDYMATEDFGLHTVQVAMDVKDTNRYWQTVVDQLSHYR